MISKRVSNSIDLMALAVLVVIVIALCKAQSQSATYETQIIYSTDGRDITELVRK